MDELTLLRRMVVHLLRDSGASDSEVVAIMASKESLQAEYDRIRYADDEDYAVFVWLNDQRKGVLNGPT